jgi:hypothetical protein
MMPEGPFVTHLRAAVFSARRQPAPVSPRTGTCAVEYYTAVGSGHQMVLAKDPDDRWQTVRDLRTGLPGPRRAALNPLTG